MLTFDEVCAEYSSRYIWSDAADAREDAEWTRHTYNKRLDKIWRTVETLHAHWDALENYDKRQQQQQRQMERKWRGSNQGIYNESGTQIGSTCRCEDYPCCGH